MTDFNTMTKAELRAYLVAHPHGIEVFQAFVDRFTSDASSQTFSGVKSLTEVEEVDGIIRQKVIRTNQT